MDERGQRRRPPAAARARHLVFVLSGSDRPCQFAVVRGYGSHTSGTSMLPRSAVSRGTSANVARRTEPTSRCSSPARPDQTRRRGRPKLVQLLAKRQPTVRTRRPPGLCDGTVRSVTSIAPVARCEPRPRALPPSVVSGRVWAIAVVPGARRDPATLFGVVQTCFSEPQVERTGEGSASRGLVRATRRAPPVPCRPCNRCRRSRPAAAAARRCSSRRPLARGRRRRC